MNNKTTFTQDTKQKINHISKSMEKMKEEISQIYANQAILSKRMDIIEDGAIKNYIIKLLVDSSKTGKFNYSIEAIQEKILNDYRVNLTEYQIRKIQKEEGIERKGGRVSFK